MRNFLGRLHLYAGLFVSPFLVVYCITAIAFNHAVSPGAAESEVTRGLPVQADTSLDNLPLAEDIIRQLGIRGEIIFVGRNPKSLYIPVGRPGEKITVSVDLVAGTADVTREETGLYDALLYLHKSPGPHVAAIRGNWWATVVWRALADSTVFLTLFLSASGIYLWLAFGVVRRTGVILAGAGSLLFIVLIMALV